MQNTRGPTARVLRPTWEGLYQVIRVVKPDTYALAYQDKLLIR